MELVCVEPLWHEHLRQSRRNSHERFLVSLRGNSHWGGWRGAVAIDSGGTALIADGTFQGSSLGGVGLGFGGSSGQIFGGTVRGVGGGEPEVVATGGDLSISGGTFQGGNYGQLGFGGAGLSVISSVGSVEISGGIFQAGHSLNGFSFNAVSATVAVHGSLKINGGLFEASKGGSGLQNSLSFFGQDETTANISGGSFSGPIEIGLLNSSTATFAGSGLLFDPLAGTLTGTLEDGSAINNFILLENPLTTYMYGIAPDGSETVTFSIAQSAPEPSSVVTLLFGSAGVAIAFIRRRLRASRPPLDVTTV